MPLISVIIPAFNAAATLRQTVATAQEQSIGDLEILIVDNGSRDGTKEIACGLAAQDRRVKVLEETQPGVSAARNKGLEHATGNYVHFLDADDLVCEGGYENLVRAEALESCGAAAGMYEVFSQEGESLLQPDIPATTFGLREVIERNVLHGVSQLIRRDVIGARRFDTGYVGYEDQDMWIRLAETGVKWAVCRRLVGRYRITRGSLSKSALMLPCAEDVFIRAAIRTGSLSETELRIRTGDCALAYSTRAALLSTSGVESGARLFASARVKPLITGHRAAAMGHSQTIYALGCWPRPDMVLPCGSELLPQLEFWWRSCIENGWMKASEMESAKTTFTQLCVEPNRIARAILSVCSREITLVGSGRNTNWFLKQSLHGHRIFVRDDRLPGGELNLPIEITVEPLDAPVPIGRTVVITTQEDEELAKRFPGAFRWKLVRNQLAGMVDSARVPVAA